MANTVIVYDVTAPGGQLVITGIKQLQLGAEYLTRAAAMLVAADAGAVPGNIETANAQSGSLFGVAAGNGAAFTAAVNALATAINNTNKAAISQLQRG